MGDGTTCLSAVVASVLLSGAHSREELYPLPWASLPRRFVRQLRRHYPACRGAAAGSTGINEATFHSGLTARSPAPPSNDAWLRERSAWHWQSVASDVHRRRPPSQ